ncbi:hypothetical protein SDC9_16183 [bioreactor metagenome]|jgi:TrmH family RNA methyltransferase|uniref:tRNA/rRNA methyltransferase SpoU type domain-containing protein n=1 Tax=bioreactor metagenome TaxID=1076179 RepID=A0A644TVC3_9ZZZZ|nr:RNA methyltransferase [Spirochaetales bacterium]NLX44845.1 RNA methyltransferase [Treponema sp.]HAP55020.1 hypothetical protein [Spirochaetaceae bacterium]HOI22948.1 RNA methyltransferase [Spirochaetales bacterium]
MNTTSVDKAADTAVVLCRVKESGNVGSICRAMKTMGFTKLVLSNCPDYDEALVRTMAVHASDIFENAQRYADLEDALSAYSLSAGFTRRSGARRKAASISARDFARGAAGLPVPDAPFIQRNQSIAMVFGNERDGLSDHELSLCSLAVHIPSSDKFPSLNVAQAVQVACYEFFTSGIEAGNIRAESKKPAAQSQVAPAAMEYFLRQDQEAAPPKHQNKGQDKGHALSRLGIELGVDEIIGAFAERGAFKQSDDSFLRGFLRDLCERAGVRRYELEYLRKVFFKAFALGSKSERIKKAPGKYK